MRWLGRREYAVAEMRRRLERAGAEPDLAAEVVTELESEGLLSDRRFAGYFARSRVARSQGPRKIRAELAGRGVDDADIDAALETVVASDSDGWVALAAAWLERHGGIPPADDAAERSRAYGRLCRRGFTHDQAMTALAHRSEPIG